MGGRIDKRGRVHISKGLRQRFGLEPGCPVIVDAEADGVKIRPAVSRETALTRLLGVIPKSANSPPGDAANAKGIWKTDSLHL